MKLQGQLLVSLLIFASMADGSTAGTSYLIQDLGVDCHLVLGASINEQGHVLFGLQAKLPVETSTVFFFDGESTTDLTYRFASGSGFNDKSEMVGIRRVGVDGENIVVRYPAPGIIGLPDAVYQLEGSGSYIAAMNNDGSFVGWHGPASLRRAFMFSSSGHFTDLGTLGGQHSLAHALNERGQVVGMSTTGATPEELEAGAPAEEAFLYENGQMIGLGTLGGGTSIARAINERGQIVGDSSLVNHEFHAFLYDPILGMQDIGLPGHHSVSYDINDFGVVAGRQYDPSGRTPSKAFIYDPSSGLQYLDDIVASLKSWTSFLSATGINNRGQIVGTGQLDGETRIFLMTPIPEPASLLLIMAAAILLAGLRCKRRPRRRVVN